MLSSVSCLDNDFTLFLVVHDEFLAPFLFYLLMSVNYCAAASKRRTNWWLDDLLQVGVLRWACATLLHALWRFPLLHQKLHLVLGIKLRVEDRSNIGLGTFVFRVWPHSKNLCFVASLCCSVRYERLLCCRSGWNLFHRHKFSINPFGLFK